VVLAGRAALDEQPIGPIQKQHGDRAVKATGSPMRIELAQHADGAASPVDEFDQHLTIFGITHGAPPPGPRAPSDEQLPDDDRVERQQCEQQREVGRGELEEAPGMLLGWSAHEPDARQHQSHGEPEHDARD